MAKIKTDSWSTATKSFVGIECTANCPSGNLQKEANEKIIKLSREMNVPLLMTQDAHFVRPEQKFLQDIVLSKEGSETGFAFSNSYHLIETEEAWARWCAVQGYSHELAIAFAESVENNTKFVDMIEPVKLEKAFHLPPVELPIEIESREDMTQDQKLERYVLKLIKGYGRMPADERRAEYAKRLAVELDVIARNGTVNFLPYFICVHDICKYARDNDILVGPGRGSAAGSLLSYLLKITHIDPVKHNLSFARFLSVGRIKRGKFPDIDLDFGDPDVIAAWLKSKHGDKFARICTTGTAKVRGAVKDVSRILLDTPNNPAMLEHVNNVCKTIGVIPQGMDDTKRWLYGWEDGEGAHPGHIDENATLKEFFDTYPEVKKGVDGVLDVPRSIGRHASGYCLSDIDLPEILPMCLVKDEVCTQFTMGPVEELGLLKIDLLGLNTLKQIRKCVDLIKERTGEEIDVYNIPDGDEATMQSFCEGRNETVFQFNGDIGIKLCREVQPKGVSDLSQITANGRPGTMYALLEDGVTTLIDAWIQRRQGLAPVEYVHPDLEDILKETHGVFTYQEQLMAAFVKCCGFSEERADEIREVIGKKKKDKMDALLPEIRQALTKNGWNVTQIDSFISLCIAASSYAFNKSHSAAYAYVGYVCQYLKTHFPLEWWTAVLQSSEPKKISEYSRSCQDYIIPPDVNRSDLEFYILDGYRQKIVYPIGKIKGVGGAGEYVVQGRPYQSFEDFYNRVDRTKVNKKVVMALIWSGALDQLCGITDPLDRNRLVEEYSALRRDKNVPEPLSEFDVLLKQNEMLPLNSANFSELISRHKGRHLVELDQMHLLEKDTFVTIGGVINRIHVHTPKKENAKPMAFLDVTDRSIACSVTMFADLYAKSKAWLGENLVVMISGKINDYNGKRGVVANDIQVLGKETVEETQEAQADC